MAHIKIPVTKIKNTWLRRLVIALTFPFVIALRVVLIPLALLVAVIDVIWSCCEDVAFTARGAAAVWSKTVATTGAKE